MATSPLCSIPTSGKTSRKTPQGDARRYYEEVVLTHEGDECLIWPFARDRGGYGHVGGKAVHRLVCRHVNGPEPAPKLDAAHSCGKGHLGCVNPRHLSWKTRSENQRDRIEHGTDWRGERNRQAKLVQDDVLRIRAMRGIVSQNGLARMFSISRQAISDIHCRKKWAWLE